MAYNILLADDEPGILKVLGIYLNDAGFSVETVGNGRQAARLVKTGDFDIVLTDIRMPGMNGTELLKHIKTVSPDTEVIMITGHGDFKLAIESLKLDAVDFIAKPIDNDILDIALKRAVDRIETRAKLRGYTADLEQMVKEKTAQLGASQKRYARLFNESPSFITVQDKEFNIVETNRLFTDQIDYRPGMTCFEAYKKRSAPCTDCPVKKTFEDGHSHHAEMEIIKKDGRHCHILIQTSGILDAKGRLTHVMEMATDVTMVRELKDHLASLGLHISSISHGIKQLLTGVDGGSYLLESGLKNKNPELIDEGWGIVKTKITDIQKMVLEILYHSKKRKPETATVLVTDLVDELIKSIAPQAQKKKIALHVAMPDENLRLNIDRMSVMAAFSTLLENAVEACESGKIQNPRINFSIARKSDYLVAAVTDNGPGVGPDDLDKLFDPFYSKKKSKGTGLGLFIAQRTVKQHNGSIRVESKPEKQTTFTICLPLHPDIL